VPTYNYISLASAVQQLANRLYDSAQNFWNNAELVAYVQESLRTWNALTSYWRAEFIFSAVPLTTFYDITNLTTAPNTLRPLTLTDASLYPVIQNHLLEPPSGVNPWASVSSQFTANDLMSAVQRRRDELLSITGAYITRRLVPAVQGRIQLPDTVIDIRRVAYLPQITGLGYGLGLYGSGAYGYALTTAPANSTLWPEDAWGMSTFNRKWTTQPAGTPLTYLQTTEPPISFDVDRAPAYGGNYEVLTIEAGAAITPATPTPLLVPDDWTHVIKWGALADLFSRESNAKDSLRAEYCNQRYRMGAALLTSAPALLAMRIENIPLQIDSVRSADHFQANWQSKTPAKPSTVLTAGLNLIALNATPGLAHSLTATVVQNAPVPSAPADLVQVSRDDLDVIIDYAQHLASLKMGGAEFSATLPLFQRFLKQASLYGLKLSEIAEYTDPIFNQSQLEDNTNPRTAPVPVDSNG
jgi:hypothetical protein